MKEHPIAVRSPRRPLLLMTVLGAFGFGLPIANNVDLNPESVVALVTAGVVALACLGFYLALLKTNARLGAEIQERTVSEAELKNTLLKVTQEHQSLLRYDPLTGLPNRALFMDCLAHDVGVGQRHRAPFALLLLDIDHFQYVNDTLGHSVGDQLLVEVAHRLKTCLRADDTVAYVGGDVIARFGSDEFAVLMRNVFNAHQAAGFAERILGILERDMSIQGHEVQAGASIGIALFPGDGTDVETLIKRAEGAMHRAKKLGGKRFGYFETEIENRVKSLLTLNSDLRHAIEREEFVLHYQPVVRLHDRRVEYFEALIRWRRGGTLLMPNEFIGHAEDTGLIGRISGFVIDRVCRQARTVLDAGIRMPPISFNVSAREFQQDELPALIQQAVERYRLEPSMLEMEITESALITDPASACRVLQQIAGAGIRIAIDDFGAGHSSLNYLVDYPISKIKIDQRFVRSALDAERNGVIVSAIVELGRRLGIQAVAEGVETEEQHRFLQRQGCEYGQGYWYAKPMPADEAFRAVEPFHDASWQREQQQ
jgi:diguanylate cyclase (GGDEF)-like protein